MAVPDKLTRLTLCRNGLLNSLLETAGAVYTIDQSADLKLVFMARASEIDDTYTEFKTLHNQIIGLIEEEAFDTHDAIRRKAEVAYFRTKATLHKITSSNPDTQDPVKSVVSPKLNKITIPIIAGNYKSWPSFYDLYRSLVHDNDTLSDVAKYQYLVTSLSEEPLHLIKGLPMTDANYSIAFDTLKKRYQNKRHLATLYYNEIQCVTIKQEGSSKAYRLLIDTFSENVEGLKTLGFPVESWDFMLFNILL
ncbi:uncharacterized protein [Onthophagus taurus]|uniref:uncharacterized protein n=1 Tax=Onthophagus taurus TaxID=166361 RepID=UPI0039BE41C1